MEVTEVNLVRVRNVGPIVFVVGLGVSALNVVSIPILKGSLIEILPIFRNLDWRITQAIALGLYLSGVALAVLGSIAFAVLRRRARRTGQPEPAYAVFRPFIWTAVINLALWGVVYVAAQTW